MNRIIIIIKNIFLFLVSFLMFKYIIAFDVVGIDFVIYALVFLGYLFVAIKDYVQKNKIRYNKNYNILIIITLFIISFIFIRTLYDTSFIYNDNNCIKLINDNYPNNSYIDEIKYDSMLYLYQNLIYFILLFIMIFIYRRVNMEK